MHYYAGPGAKNSVATEQDKSGKGSANGYHNGSNAPKMTAAAAASAAAATSADTRATSSTPAATSPVAEASALKANGKKVNGIPLGYTIDIGTHNTPSGHV